MRILVYPVLYAVFVGLPAAAMAAPLDHRAIGVDCKVSSPALEAIYGASNVSEMEKRFCQNVLQQLGAHDELGLWEYHDHDATKKDATTLKIRIADGPKEDVRIYVTAQLKDARALKDSATWLKDPDAAHPEKVGEAEAALEELISAQLKDRWGTSLVKYFKVLPVAQALPLEPQDKPLLSVVSSLEWERYRHLQGSQFTVVCSKTDTNTKAGIKTKADTDFVRLLSRGQSQAKVFQQNGVAAGYAALALSVMGRLEGSTDSLTPVTKCGAELVGLTPTFLLFGRRDDPGFEAYAQ